MAETTFMPTGQYGSDQLIEDLSKIAEIAESEVASLSDALSSLEGIPSSQQLFAIVEKEITDSEAQTAVISAIGNISPDSVEDVLKALDEVYTESAKVKSSFGKKNLASLKKNLPLLIREYPAISRYQEANYLNQLTGCAADGVDIVCDLRPLFSEDRQKIIGLVPRTVFRLSYESQNGTNHVVEVNLSEVLLKSLAEQVSVALLELKAIQAAGEQWTPRGVFKLS